MELMLWDAKYSVGNAEIDSQHKKLFEMINSLIKESEKRNSRDTLEKILEDMVDYIEEHFNYEESFFSKHPEAPAHRMMHAEFMKKTMGFSKAFARGETEMADEILEFLTTWLKNHTLNVDINFFKNI